MSYATVRAATSPELAYLRTAGQWSRLYLAIFQPTVMYSARLSAVPSSNDRVVQLSFTGGSGTLGNVLPGMTLYAGTTAGAYDLGMARVRKAPISGTFYIGEESDIAWDTVVSGGIYITVVNEFDLWAKHINTVSDTVFYMDYDVTYTDQHVNFDPIPIMGGHRVLKLTGASISTIFDFSNSYVLGSTITGYSCSAPTASSSSGMTTATPTITFNTAGWHMIILTVTAANGKTFTGIRYVYVYSSASMPSNVFQLGNCAVDYETGGWSFEVTMQNQIGITSVPERSMAILFAEEFYGDTQISIGQLAGCENIICVGKISEEHININAEQSEVTLRIQGMQYWLQQVFAFPTGVIQTTGVAADWGHMNSPTVDKVIFRLLHWGSNATQIMDVYLTNDTRIASELISPASNIWAQMQEIAFATIQARTGVDRFGRLFVEVEPQVVPVSSRVWAVVMTLTKKDYYDSVNIQRVVVTPTGMVNTSGVVVDSSASGNALFSLSKGHVFNHYGTPEIIDRLLLSTQAISNQVAGLINGWRNNPYPSSEFTLSANNRMIDCFPRQSIAWSVSAGDSPRGVTISGNFVPRRVELIWDSTTGFMETAASLELGSVEQLSVNGDVPGNGGADLSNPPAPPAFPPLPDFAIIVPGDITGGALFGEKWLFHDTVGGMVYTENFNAGLPDYLQMNNGLTLTEYQAIEWIGVCRGGAIYVACLRDTPNFIARTSGLAGTWTKMTLPVGYKAIGVAIDSSVSERIGFITRESGGTKQFHTGTYTSYSTLALGSLSDQYNGPIILSHGQGHGAGEWIALQFFRYTRINDAGTSILNNDTLVPHGFTSGRDGLRASDTGTQIIPSSVDNKLFMATGNMTEMTEQHSTIGLGLIGTSSGITYYNGDCNLTGQFIMGDTALIGKAKSSDYGASWATLPALPPGNYTYQYAGMNGSLPKFVAARAIIRATPDFGVTWINKEDPSYWAINPFPNINLFRAYGLGVYGHP